MSASVERVAGTEPAWSVEQVAEIPVADEQRVYLRLKPNAVAAYAPDGRALFRTTPNEETKPGPLLPDGPKLLVTGSRELVVLEAETGRQLARWPLTTWVHHRPALREDLLVLEPEAPDDRIAAYGLPAFERRWELTLERPTAGCWIHAGRHSVVYGTRAGRELVGVHPRSGERLWELPIAEIGRYHDPISGRQRDGRAIGALTEVGHILVVPVYAGRFLGLDARTGGIVWNTRVPVTNPATSVMGADGLVHALGSKRYVALRGETGEILRELDVESELRAHGIGLPGFPAYAHGVLYAADVPGGKPFGLSVRDGRVVWQPSDDVKLIEPHAPVCALDHLLMLDPEGTLRAYPIDKEGPSRDR